jgi:hypothetical protein
LLDNPVDLDLTLVDRGESKDRGGFTELCGIGWNSGRDVWFHRRERD